MLAQLISVFPMRWWWDCVFVTIPSLDLCYNYAILIHWGLVRAYGCIDVVNIGAGNGLLPDGNKPLPQPMLTYYQQSPVALIEGTIIKFEVISSYRYRPTFQCVLFAMSLKAFLARSTPIYLSQQSLEYSDCNRHSITIAADSKHLGLYSLNKRRLMNLWIPIINLRRPSDHL